LLNDMTKILMVCLGNICRSPLAEAILNSKLNDTFQVDSCGTGGWHQGELPDPRSIKVAQKFDIDITYQRARQINTSDLENFHHIFVMDKNNYNDVLALCKNDTQKQKIKLLLEEANHPLTNVPDPYYGTEKDFIEVFQLLDKACETVAQKLLNGK
jgi:protein-tyrosine phosphatase